MYHSIIARTLIYILVNCAVALLHKWIHNDHRCLDWYFVLLLLLLLLILLRSNSSDYNIATRRFSFVIFCRSFYSVLLVVFVSIPFGIFFFGCQFFFCQLFFRNSYSKYHSIQCNRSHTHTHIHIFQMSNGYHSEPKTKRKII